MIREIEEELKKEDEQLLSALLPESAGEIIPSHPFEDYYDEVPGTHGNYPEPRFGSGVSRLRPGKMLMIFFTTVYLILNLPALCRALIHQ